MSALWQPHNPQTWPWRNATLKQAALAKTRHGHGANPEFTAYTIPAGTEVRIVMVSRLGDVGITTDLAAERCYVCRADDGPDGMLAYTLAIQNPRRDDPSWPLPSFDARDWAKAFCEIAAKLGHPGIDEAWMTTWFANALMRGYDEHVMRSGGVPT